MMEVSRRFLIASSSSCCCILFCLLAYPCTAFSTTTSHPSLKCHKFSMHFESTRRLQLSRRKLYSWHHVPCRRDILEDDASSGSSSTLLESLRMKTSALRASFQARWDRLRTSLSRRTTTNNDVEKASTTVEKITSSSSSTGQSTQTDLPKGSRWAVAHPNVDLSGTWKPIITADFLKQYDEYLANCGASYFFRQLCLKFCSTTRETITQAQDGRILELNGQTPAGSWKRSIISSGAESSSSNEYDVQYAEFLDPDKELVQVEAWWEEQGSIHKSILRNKPTVRGGEFETLRYLNNNTKGGNDATTVSDDSNSLKQTTLVTESIFRPGASSGKDSKFKPTYIRWEYTRV